MEQAISQVGLTFHLLSEASSSIVPNACSKREPDSSLLNGRAPRDRLFEQQECGLISCCLQTPVPPRWANFHPANTQATRFLLLQTAMACVLGYYNIKCSVWLWKNQAGTLLKTHTWKQWVALPIWAPISPLTWGPSSRRCVDGQGALGNEIALFHFIPTGEEMGPERALVRVGESIPLYALNGF